MSARVFDFTHAIARVPGRSVVNGLRDDTSVTPTYERVLEQHTAYVAALRAVGLKVDVLPALEAFPDSVFVEDPAIVMREGAIVMRPGAPSRLRETDEIRGALDRHFPRVLELGDAGYADGGDILITPETIFIGLSARTNRAGAEDLQAKLKELGRQSRIAETPPGVLHFKTVSSLLGEDTVLVTKAMADSGFFTGFKQIVTPAGEEAAANALRVNDTVFLGDTYPRTIELVRKHGFTVVPVAVDEVAKLDAGLSCMSLRW